ncbi:MAG: GNAT family N-acetyltransferase [Rhizobium sp.]|nr:GNAT family N-acetyltransferase [Rhizobium sp.]
MRNRNLKTANVTLRVDPFPSNDVLNGLWEVAWNSRADRDFSAILSRSLGHIGAFAGGQLVGFINIAWDGGIHAFLLDTCVTPVMRRQGIATQLVDHAIELARNRGAEWLHVDFEHDLGGLYRKCGFRPTAAGVIKLT